MFPYPLALVMSCSLVISSSLAMPWRGQGGNPASGDSRSVVLVASGRVGSSCFQDEVVRGGGRRTAGLEVILEEPEEDYCSSHGSEDDLQRDVDITHELKGERRSLDGSEGIGSAEGDSHSSGGSEHYGEEDCASSGIHSEGTFVHPVREGRGWS
ncbi:hypothetical protein C7M84_023366 [Penaeus vannamei]|uniref:Uncharacterized protein n=1 Tax=Penaeus vannamei TaxID=6689 RepID=A0A3R7MQS4_PENVA|nr:hypothetical protein C7M84_023366 [Penaeus vannamei]